MIISTLVPMTTALLVYAFLLIPIKRTMYVTPLVELAALYRLVKGALRLCVTPLLGVGFADALVRSVASNGANVVLEDLNATAGLICVVDDALIIILRRTDFYARRVGLDGAMRVRVITTARYLNGTIDYLGNILFHVTGVRLMM